MRTKKRQKGFTLTEVMIVVAIIAISAAIAVPNFLSWLPNMRLKAAARDIYSHIQKAKLEAIKRNTCTGILFTTVAYPATGGSFNIFIDNGLGVGGIACNGVQDGDESSILIDVANINNISVISASDIGGPSSVSFNNKGVIRSSQSGDIQLRNETRWHRITVSVAGGVRLESSSDGITWSP